MDLDGFMEDPKTIAAVERKLLVISEAAIRLGKDAEVLARACLGERFGELAIGCATNMMPLNFRLYGKLCATICPHFRRR